MSFESIRRFTRCTLLLGAVYVGAADAALFTVGNAPVGPNLPQGDFTCQYDKIQDAVNAAQATPRAPGEVHVIRVSYTGTYTQQQVQIGSIDLEISGGYHDCWASQQGWYEPQRETTVSGAGGGPAPVFRVRGSGVRIFRSLFITRGDNLAGDGGGIDYQGIGAVMITDSTIGANQASHGGGIYARASGGEALVEIGANVMIANNLAVRGGAVHLAGQTRLEMLQDKSTLYLNRATVEGGGLWVAGPAHALIGSPGYNGIAAIEGNRAPDGGGIAVFSKEEEPQNHRHVDLVSVDAARPVRIANNEASARGGALYARGYDEFDASGRRTAGIAMSHFVMEGNIAPHGAGAYLDADDGEGSHLMLAYSDLPSVACAVARDCYRIERNRATASDGSILHLGRGSRVGAVRVTFADNEAAQLIWTRGTDGEASTAALSQCLAHGNVLSGAMVRASGPQDHVSISACTIANNELGAEIVRLDASGARASLSQSVFDQPGAPILAHPQGPGSDRITSRCNVGINVEGISTSDTTSLSAHPRFVDPAYDDFRLRPGSPAIDHAPTGDPTTDIERVARDRDFLLKADVHGPGDAGAHEFSPRGNLAINGGFASDLRAWEIQQPYVVLDAFDLSGSYAVPGRNSARVLVPPGAPGHVVGLRQCLHLPTSGHYRIDARAVTRSVLSDLEDIPILEWSYQPNAGESCTGLVASTGNAQFAPAPNQDLLVWRSIANAPVVNVPAPGTAGGWTPNAAIEIRLRVQQHPNQDPAQHNLYALFDGIEVTHSEAPATVELFADGFE